MSFSILLSLTQADGALLNYNKLKIYNITQLQNHPYCILYICLVTQRWAELHFQYGTSSIIKNA